MCLLFENFPRVNSHCAKFSMFLVTDSQVKWEIVVVTKMRLGQNKMQRMRQLIFTLWHKKENKGIWKSFIKGLKRFAFMSLMKRKNIYIKPSFLAFPLGIHFLFILKFCFCLCFLAFFLFVFWLNQVADLVLDTLWPLIFFLL